MLNKLTKDNSDSSQYKRLPYLSHCWKYLHKTTIFKHQTRSKFHYKNSECGTYLPKDLTNQARETDKDWEMW